jgi:hypothetical protein
MIHIETFNNNNKYKITVDGLSGNISVTEDPYTGDWAVFIDNRNGAGTEYFLTKDGAMKYVFEFIGLIEDADYEFAPERC